MAPLTPLTPEQIAFLTAQTEHAAQKAVKRYRDRAFVGFTVLLLGIGGLGWIQQADSNSARQAIVISGRNVATDSCNARFTQQQVLRRIVRAGIPVIRQYVVDGTLTPSQGERAIEDARSNIKKLTLPDCRVVRNVLTDDPGDLRPNHPAPLYPGGPGSHTRPQKG